MNTLRELLTILLVSTLISAVIGNLEATKSVNKVINERILKVEQSKEVGKLKKYFIPLCCTREQTWSNGICKDNDTSSILASWINVSVTNVSDNVKVIRRPLDYVTDDPCDFHWMEWTVLDNFHMLWNASIFTEHYAGGSLLDVEHYCLLRKVNSSVFSAKVCRPWVRYNIWHIYATIFSIFVLVVVVICYSVAPELRNIHAMVFRAYIITYLGIYASVTTMFSTSESKTYDELFTVSVFSIHYFGHSCAFWLTVMSFNIWRTFRGQRDICHNTEERKKKRFIRYAIYAWVCPAVLIATTGTIMQTVPYFQNFSFNKSFLAWECAAIISAVFVCNTYIFISTALAIKAHKRDTAHLIEGVNKHHDLNEQWFNLHVKLILIMGGHTIMWVIWVIWSTPLNTSLVVTLEAVQSILIFFIFVWKKNVRRSLRQRFGWTRANSETTDRPSRDTSSNTPCSIQLDVSS